MTSLDKPSEECAARVMETVPLLMGFIRAEMRTHSADSLSMLLGFKTEFRI